MWWRESRLTTELPSSFLGLAETPRRPVESWEAATECDCSETDRVGLTAAACKYTVLLHVEDRLRLARSSRSRVHDASSPRAEHGEAERPSLSK